MQYLSTLVVIYCLGWIIAQNVYDKRNVAATSLNRVVNLQDNGIEINGRMIDPIFAYRRSENRPRSRRHVRNRKSRPESHSRRLAKYRGYRDDNDPIDRDDDSGNIVGSSRKRRSHRHQRINTGRDTNNQNEESTEDDEDPEYWTEWSDWTKCSVTCGNGRRVRWRHCSAENCTSMGIKRAEMKTCHREDCPTKGLFGWIGIK